MPALADTVLPLIRTRADLHRWSAANAHGRDVHEAIDILEAATVDGDPGEVYQVAHAALASAVSVIARADDSSGILGDGCRRLLELHPRLAAAAAVTPSKLVAWMVTFQFEGTVDYFELDPVAYAPALGEKGLTTYRARLEEVRAGLQPEPSSPTWPDPDRHARWVLSWNDRRLAILDRDVEAIVRTHARDRRVAAWLKDTAEAFVEIERFDLALDWARQAVDFDLGHQSRNAAHHWLALVGEHRPEELLAATLYVFRRWPSSSTAAALHRITGVDWSEYEEEVMTALRSRPGDAVTFCLTTLQDPGRAWKLAGELGLDDEYRWAELVRAYEQIDAAATVPVHRRLVESALERADAKQYRAAARRLAHVRTLVAGTDEAGGVDEFVAELRQAHRRRPRLQQEFDRAGLP